MREFSMTFPWLFHNFPGLSMTYVVFHDYPGLEFGLSKSHDFPGPVVTLQIINWTGSLLSSQYNSWLSSSFNHHPVAKYHR